MNWIGMAVSQETKNIKYMVHRPNGWSLGEKTSYFWVRGKYGKTTTKTINNNL